MAASAKRTSKKRSSTPGPPQDPSPAPPVAKSPQAPVLPKEVVAERPSPTSPAGDSPRRTYDTVASPRCTDLCCTLIFLLFTGGLAYAAWRGTIEGDRRRLLHGFDFRGNLCGDQAQGGSRSAGEFVYWCGRLGQGNWSDPICVQSCPRKSEMVDCPDGKPEVTESEGADWNGGVMLTRVSKQKLSPLAAKESYKVGKYCLPTGMGQAIKDLLSHADGSAFDTAFRVALLDFGEIATKRLLVASIVVAAFVAGLVFLIVLFFFTNMVVHLGFIVFCFGFLCSGILVFLAPSVDQLHLNDVIKGAAQRTITILAVGDLSWLSAYLGVHARLIVSAVLVGVGVLSLLAYLWKWTAISMATRSCQEACRIVFKNPSLLWLPIVELFMSLIVLLLAGYAALVVLSTSEVRPSAVDLLGTSVSGLYRSFDWTLPLISKLLACCFAGLWYYELVAAFRTYILSEVVVGAWQGEDDRWLPMMTYMFKGIRYHFGSLAMGAFCLACVRLLQYTMIVLHRLFGKEDDGGMMHKLFGVFHGLLAFVEAVVKYTNEHAYTDLALTSSSFFGSSRAAGVLMLKNADLLWSRYFVLKPIMFVAQIAYSATFGWGVWVLLRLLSKVETGLFAEYQEALNSSLAEALGSNLTSPGLVGIIAFLLCFIVVRAFTAIQDGIATAIVYCYMWDKEDGTINGNMPEAFYNLLLKIDGNIKVKQS